MKVRFSSFEEKILEKLIREERREKARRRKLGLKILDEVKR